MTDVTATTSGALSVANVVKSYAGTPVLKGVSVSVRPGEIVGLVGHNGAGKSTLLRVISGATKPDSGGVSIGDRELSLAVPADAYRAGISTVYQELSLVPNLTVAQNVFLGAEDTTGGFLKRSEMRRITAELTESFGLDVDPDRRVSDYPVATRQLLEVAIATRRGGKFLLLDEPTTSLEGRQVDTFLDTVRSLAERGFGILLVDHKLDELYAVATRIVALVDGEVVIDRAVADLARNEVVEAIAGHEVAEGTGPRAIAPAEESPVSLSVRDLRGPVLEGVTLEARAGRVLGIYGLVGSGRTEFLRSLAGLEPVKSGSIELDGAPYQPRGARRAQRAGIAYVTEERKIDGIVPMLNSTTNVMLPVLEKYSRLGFLQRGAINRRATEEMDRLAVRGNRSIGVERLSGGNQQKILLSRALVEQPRFLLLDEPTKGVDLGVKEQIHHIIRDLAHDDGLTVIVVSSEDEEICEVSDDVVIFAHGATDGVVLSASDVTPADLRHAAWRAA